MWPNFAFVFAHAGGNCDTSPCVRAGCTFCLLGCGDIHQFVFLCFLLRLVFSLSSHECGLHLVARAHDIVCVSVQ